MTQVLTPQEAAELLKELQYAKAAMGGHLSIRDEYFKQALEQLPRWIPCSEQIPVQKKGERFLPLILLLNERTVVWGGWDDEKFWDGAGNQYSNVTHWMPFPEAPL